LANILSQYQSAIKASGDGIGLVNCDSPHYHSTQINSELGCPTIRYKHVNCTVSSAVAIVNFIPAGPGASIDATVAAELRDCCGELALRDELAVVIVAGSGDTFAVGRAEPPGDVRDAPMLRRIAWLDSLRVADTIAALPMPVIAQLNGDAIAHGLEIALAADIRVASPSARLGTGNPTQDGFPFDGATQRLPRLIGPAHARDLLYTGRNLTARAAREIGLVNQVAPMGRLDEFVGALADEIAAAAPIASRFAKEAVLSGADLTLEQSLRLEADLSIMLQSTDDRAEGLRSFRDKRAPQFTGR
jgi:enoyl-CoA hydratase/carnithine racemase